MQQLDLNDMSHFSMPDIEVEQMHCDATTLSIFGQICLEDIMPRTIFDGEGQLIFRSATGGICQYLQQGSDWQLTSQWMIYAEIYQMTIDPQTNITLIGYLKDSEQMLRTDIPQASIYIDE